MRNRCTFGRLSRSWRGRRAAALALVLWVMAILSAVALQLSFSSHLRLKTVAAIGQGTQALFLARAGIERAVADLKEGRNAIQGLHDLRETPTNPYSNVEVGAGSYTLLARTQRCPTTCARNGASHFHSTSMSYLCYALGNLMMYCRDSWP